MSASTSRSAACLAVTVLLIVLASGCGGGDDTATPTATSPASTASATASPTTPTVLPMSAEELAWLKAITRLHKKIDKAVQQELTLTRAKMVALGTALGACSRELRRIGSPSDRLQPVNTIVKKACRTFDKGAKCFATAARVSDASGAVVAGTPEERTQRRSIDCGFAAAGNGSNTLADAENKGAEIKLAAGS
jgi:hypothetical protein